MISANVGGRSSPPRSRPPIARAGGVDRNGKEGVIVQYYSKADQMTPSSPTRSRSCRRCTKASGARRRHHRAGRRRVRRRSAAASGHRDPGQHADRHLAVWTGGRCAEMAREGASLILSRRRLGGPAGGGDSAIPVADAQPALARSRLRRIARGAGDCGRGTGFQPVYWL